MGLFTKLFGTRSEREVKKLEPQVEAVMALEKPAHSRPRPMNSSAAGRSSSTAQSIRTDTVSPRGIAAR